MTLPKAYALADKMTVDGVRVMNVEVVEERLLIELEQDGPYNNWMYTRKGRNFVYQFDDLGKTTFTNSDGDVCVIQLFQLVPITQLPYEVKQS